MHALTIRRINASLIDDFYRVHTEANGLGWCRCVAWLCPWDEFKNRTEEQNKTQRDALFAAGTFDGYLLYLDDHPIGWSQCAPIDDLPKLRDSYHVPENSTAWAIGCISLALPHRGKGLAGQFLNLIVADVKSRGIPRVYGFPKRNTDDPWTGPEPVFKAQGFILEKEAERGPVYVQLFSV